MQQSSDSVVRESTRAEKGHNSNVKTWFAFLHPFWEVFTTSWHYYFVFRVMLLDYFRRDLFQRLFFWRRKMKWKSCRSLQLHIIIHTKKLDQPRGHIWDKLEWVLNGLITTKNRDLEFVIIMAEIVCVFGDSIKKSLCSKW